MPKSYSESERAYIKERLMEEAEKCLAQYGIRKTTVDELVRRVNIPKGTFYLFYESKERLLFDVILRLNDEIQEQLLQEISGLPEVPDAETIELPEDAAQEQMPDTEPADERRDDTNG